MIRSQARQDAKRQPEFLSWGHYPRLHSQVVRLNWTTDFPIAGAQPGPMLPVGMGRSYGDSCLLDGGTLLDVRGMMRLIHFDAETGLLRCEAGATLEEILRFSIPRGWFLPVVPGTQFVTVGGAIANDIHGKNHHVAGTFGSHVPQFELARTDGLRIVCSPAENADWYQATIGGMGLTGLITWAEIQLRPITSDEIEYTGTKFHGIDEFLGLSTQAAQAEYTVAWIDCVSGGRNFARGIFMQGRHASSGALRVHPKPRSLSVPAMLPAVALNRAFVQAFNSLYFHKHIRREVHTLLDYRSFFFPLDEIRNWNRIYGSKGLLQFQCILPLEKETAGITQLLRAVNASGFGSFLAVLKVFGSKASPGMMSFPRSGVTVALDFPIRGEDTFELFDRLASITLEHGGRIYPAKDARMTALMFQAFYPQWRSFARYIDPGFSSAFWKRVSQDA